MWYRIITSGKEDVLRVLNDNKLLDKVRILSPYPKYQTMVAYLLNKNTYESDIKNIIHDLLLIDSKTNKQLSTNKNEISYDGHKFYNYNDIKIYIDRLISFIGNKPDNTLFINNHISDSFQIKKIDTPEEARFYGKDTAWCISTASPTYFYKYRGDGSTMYFILDPDNNKNLLQKVAAEVTLGGGIIFYNRIDKVLSTSEERIYLEYLKNKNIDIYNIFKSVPLSEEEKYIIFNTRYTPNLDIFVNLEYKLKEIYLSRNRITHEQLLSLIQNKSWDLINTYIKSGLSIPPSQLDVIKNIKPSFQKTYEKYRNRNLDHVISNLLPNEKSPTSKLVSWAYNSMDYELIDWILSNGIEIKKGRGRHYNNEFDAFLKSRNIP